jgi:hypothetical protein
MAPHDAAAAELPNSTFPQKWRLQWPMARSRGEIDAATMAACAGVAEGLINTWIRRGQVPHQRVGTQGRRRVFDLATMLHVVTMAELIRAGFTAPVAARAATRAGRVGYDQPNTVMVIGSPALGRRSGLLGAPGHDEESVAPEMVSFASLTPMATEEYLVDWGRRSGDPPKVYTVIDLNRIAEDVRKFLAAREAAGDEEEGG